MIATKLPNVYKVPVPPAVSAVLETQATVITLGVDGISTTPLACLDLNGYKPKLVFWMTFPLVPAAVVLSVVAARSRAAGRCSWDAVLERASPWLLYLLFLL